MSMATAATGSSQSPSRLPLISIWISTRLPTFDLSINEPFVITVELTLNHHRPVTFSKHDTQFFQNPLGEPGLEFTNIRTGETQVGMKAQFCYIGSKDNDLPTEITKKDWITLLPGQPYTLDASITPIEGAGRIRTIAEMKSNLPKQFSSFKWPVVHRLRDGEVYEIKFNNKARVKRWIEGDLEDILEREKEGSSSMVHDKIIESEVKETARFEVKRPDRDGSLNWP